jgi:hypothetical protein
VEALAAAVEASALGVWARGSAWAYPIANVVHLLGLVMLVGGIGAVDLRLAGAWRALPAEELSRALTPVAMGGIVLFAGSGVVMFAADARALAGSDTFRWKLAAIGLALANALLFRRLWRGRLDALPVSGRAMAAASLLLWLTAATLGRLIAYR